MANNYLHPGDVLDCAAVRDVPVGSVLILGALAAVALSNIPAGKTGSVRVSGVFSLPKATDTIAAQGARAYLDGNGQLTAEAGENAPVGVFAAPAVAGALTCRIKLNVGGA